MNLLTPTLWALVSTPIFAVIRPSAKEHLLKRTLIQQELPQTPGEDWTTLENGVEFLPAADLSPLAQQHIRRLTSTTYAAAGVYEEAMIDSTETYYDDYAQAWRSLGFYIDCNYSSGDGSGCQRFILWAAYIDEEYSGNEIGEYMFYDRKNDFWDDRTCVTKESNRCVKMDCHLPDTHFSLLGFFKEPDFDDWFEQLFKHEGDCVWSDEEYGFMQGNRDVWPQGCTSTGITANTTKGGTVSLYYDIKPSPYGDMAIGLYTDTLCVVEYVGDLEVTEAMRQMVCGGGNQQHGRELENGNPCTAGESNYHDAVTVLKAQGYYQDNNHDGNHDTRGDVWELASSLDEWNAAFDVYKQCQPCKTYDLTNIIADGEYTKNWNGKRYNWTSAAMYGSSGAEENSDDLFMCSDVAGYDNVNQCYKFRTKTTMMTATWKDVENAMAQGSIAQVPFSKDRTFVYSTESTRHSRGKRRQETALVAASWVLLLVSAVLFVFSLYRYKSMKQRSLESMKEPLMASKNAVSA